MPYVSKEKRKTLAEVVQAGHAQIVEPGDLNYVVSLLMFGLMRRLGHNYSSMNAVLGAVEAAKFEFYRRVVGPYEDLKARDNGDIYL